VFVVILGVRYLKRNQRYDCAVDIRVALLILIIPEMLTTVKTVLSGDFAAGLKTIQSILNNVVLWMCVSFTYLISKDSGFRFWRSISVFVIVSTSYALIHMFLSGVVLDEYEREIGYWDGAWELSNISLCCFAGLFCDVVSQSRPPQVERIGLLASALGMLISGHRAGILSAFAFVAVYVVIPPYGELQRRLFRIKYIGMGIVLISVFFAFQPQYLERFRPMFSGDMEYWVKSNLPEDGAFEATEQTMLYRTWIMSKVLDDYDNAPAETKLFGRGAKAIFSEQLQTPTGIIEIRDAGSAYSMLLFDFGLVKVFAFIVACGVVIGKGWKKLKVSRVDDRTVPFTKGLVAFFIILPLLSFAETIFMETTIGLYFWTIMGGLTVLTPSTRDLLVSEGNSGEHS
jgi:hypothetical protein